MMKKKILGGFFFVLTFLLTLGSVYAAHYLLGVSAVDNKEIRWGGLTTYSSSWDYAVSTWNALGEVNIAPDAFLSYQDLTISDQYEPDKIYDATYIHVDPLPDEIIFNTAKFSELSTNKKKNAITHELGHALGLNHSPYGNMMYKSNMGTTTLSAQDKSDYDYLWGN